MASGPPADGGTLRDPDPGDSSPFDHPDGAPDGHGSSIFDGDDEAGSSVADRAAFHDAPERREAVAPAAGRTTPAPAGDDPSAWFSGTASDAGTLAGAGSGMFSFGGPPAAPAEEAPRAPYPVPLPYVAALGPVRTTAVVADSSRAEVAEAAPRGTARPSAGRRAASVWVTVYAITITAALAWLIYEIERGRYGRPQTLENMPDVFQNPLLSLIDTSAEYPNSTKLIVPQGAEMPYLHTLRLGESRRYGSVRVTPLRVTRGPLTFEDDGLGSPFEPAEVLKLWLRFENVAGDERQTFAPLDHQLVSLRGRTKKRDATQANSFVTRLDRKSDTADVVLMYEPNYQTPAGWNIGTEDSPPVLAPGKSVEVYLPTEEQQELDELTGELVWRVHFRKGIAENGRGVTTLVEVVFESDEIEREEPAGQLVTSR